MPTHRDVGLAVFRHDSPLGRWTVTTLRPHRLLAGVVRQIWHGEGRVAYARDRILPAAQSYLLINLGPAQYRVLPGPAEERVPFDDVWFSAITEQPIDAEAPHGSEVIGVAFESTGAARLLPWAQCELANSTGPLADLLDSRVARRLRERLRETPGTAARLLLVQRWLLDTCVTGRSIHPVVHWATRRLAESGGTVQATALARESGYSRKHLVQLFNREVGLPPRALARIHRFRHALHQMQSYPGKPWAEIAAACGYYDQSHLIRDFRQFSGFSPAELARSAMPDGTSVVVR